MMTRTLKALSITLATFTIEGLMANAVFADQIIHYANKPVDVQLHIGEERTIQFGDHVQVGITGSQESAKLFRVQSAQGALHILPYEGFTKERIQVKRMGDGRILLIDITADRDDDPSASLEDVRVLMPDEDIVATEISGEVEHGRPVTPITLTRYASQQFYGPARLHKSVPGIVAMPVGDLANVNIRAFRGETGMNTSTRAVGSFSGGNHHLVALLVSNETDHRQQLDFMDIQLPMTHATFQTMTLEPSGTAGDRTILYLINDAPIRSTLVPYDYFTYRAEHAAADERGSK